MTFIAVLASCEEPVKGDFELPEAKLVISSNFYPNEPVRVGVSSTFSLLQENEASPVTDANIFIFSGNQLLEQLEEVAATEIKPGYYITRDFVPSIDVEYTISVNAAGFNPVVAVSSIPPPVPIRSFELEELILTKQGSDDLFMLKVKLEYDDPEGFLNYYNLRLYQQYLDYMIAYDGDTIIGDSELVPVEFPVSRSNKYKLAANNGGILIKDRPGDEPLSVVIESKLNPDHQLIGNLYAELRTVSPEYYNFQHSISNDTGSSTGGSGVNPSRVVNSNVENGTGIFAGYAYASDSIPINN